MSSFPFDIILEREITYIKMEESSTSSSLKDKLVDGFKAYNSKISWFVFVLICIFSWNGWIEVFGTYIYI